jgi:hypothetical protein
MPFEGRVKMGAYNIKGYPLEPMIKYPAETETFPIKVPLPLIGIVNLFNATTELQWQWVGLVDGSGRRDWVSRVFKALENKGYIESDSSERVGKFFLRKNAINPLLRSWGLGQANGEC